TGAAIADVYLVLAQTGSPTAGPAGSYGAAGQTFFLVRAENPGILPDLSLELLGMRGSATGFVGLQDCLIDDRDRLGPEGEAAGIIAGVRESGATLGAVAVGIAQAALDLGRAHAAGRGLLELSSVGHRLVELSTQVEAVRSIVDRAGRRSAADPGITTLHSKLFASATAEQVCLEVGRMMGSAGYVVQSKLNQLTADVRAVGLMGPTNDVCRELVAETWTR
ncbi:acyl-CoA dehydrogenase family protein, partial [Nocardia gipuzkoensis]